MARNQPDDEQPQAAQVIINPGMGFSGNGNPAAPLFPNIGKGPAVPERIKVFRDDPNDGYLGTIDASSDEEYLRQRWGGRVFRLEAINASGQSIKGGRRTVVIQDAPKDLGAPRAPAELAQRPAMSFDPVAFMQGQLDLERGRAEQAEAKAKRELDAYVTRLRAENEEREKQEAARHRRDLELERERAASSRQESKDFMTTMMQMQQSANSQMTTVITAALSQTKAADPMAFASMFERGVTVAAQLGGGNDPGVEMAKTLTGGLSSLASLALNDRNPGRATVVQNKPQPRPVEGRRQVQPVPQQNPAPAAHAPHVPGGEGPAKVDRIKAKALDLFQQIAAEGFDPEEVIDRLRTGDLVLREAEPDDDEEPENQEDPPEGADDAAAPQAPPRAVPSDRRADGAGTATPALAADPAVNG